MSQDVKKQQAANFLSFTALSGEIQLPLKICAIHSKITLLRVIDTKLDRGGEILVAQSGNRLLIRRLSLVA